MVDYVKLAETSLRLISENGRTVSVTKQSTTPAVSSEPWKVNTSDEATLSPIALIKKFSSSEIDGAYIKVGDMQAVIAAADDALSSQDLTTFNFLNDEVTGHWKIEEVTILQPSDIPLVYFLQLRRG